MADKNENKKAAANDATAFCLIDRVELVGFEPTSKQGNHTLSTCLFWPSVFVTQQDPDHQLRPYPLKLHPCGEAHTGYFRFTCTALSSDSEQHPWSDVSFRQTLWRNKANLLYFD